MKLPKDKCMEAHIPHNLSAKRTIALSSATESGIFGNSFFNASPKRDVRGTNMLAVGWPDFYICMIITILSRNHLWGQRFHDNIHCKLCSPSLHCVFFSKPAGAI